MRKSYAELTYHFAASYWGKGLATEVVHAVTAFGIEDLLIHRIQGMVMIENIASQHVHEKCRYHKEGVLKLYPFAKEFHDTVVVMAYIKSENVIG